MRTWETLVFEISGLMHMEVLVHATGKQTGSSLEVWQESVVPVIHTLAGVGTDGDRALATDHLYAIYSAPDEWVRADEFDALLTRVGA